MRNEMRRISLCLVFVWALVFGLKPAAAVSAESDKLELFRQTSQAFSAVAARAVPAVVFINVERTIETGSMTGPGTPFGFNDPFGFCGDEFYDRFFRGRRPSQPREYRQTGQGSGFIIGDDGYTLTNNHVVGEADVVTVKLHDGRQVEGIGDLRNTIAMAAPGTRVKLLVHRDGKERTITVKIAELSESRIIADASEPGRRLGLTVENLTEDARRYYGLPSSDGVMVSSVNPGSAAYRNGIRPGMIILSVNRRKVDSVEQFNSALRESIESKKVLLLVRAQRYTQFVVLPLE